MKPPRLIARKPGAPERGESLLSGYIGRSFLVQATADAASVASARDLSVGG